jgi:hypothetical protein
MASSMGLPSGAWMLFSDSFTLGRAQPTTGTKRESIPQIIKSRFIMNVLSSLDEAAAVRVGRLNL